MSEKKVPAIFATPPRPSGFVPLFSPDSKCTPSLPVKDPVEVLRSLCQGFTIADDDTLLSRHTLAYILSEIPSFSIGTKEHPSIEPLYPRWDGVIGCNFQLVHVEKQKTEDKNFSYNCFVLSTRVFSPDHTEDKFSARMWNGHENYKGRAVMVKEPFHRSLGRPKFSEAFYGSISDEAKESFHEAAQSKANDQELTSRYTLFIFPPDIVIDNAIVSRNSDIPMTFTKKMKATATKHAELGSDVNFHVVSWRFAIKGTIKPLKGTNTGDDVEIEV